MVFAIYLNYLIIVTRQQTMAHWLVIIYPV